MAGAMIPVMSNSGSGNQGICATMPVVVFAEENHNTDEELVRALMLSHLTAIYIKSGCPVGLVRMCGGFHGIELWYHLPDGRKIRASLIRREEHDSEPHGDDL